MAAVPTATPIVRRRLAVRGVVQGVGFRPFVYRLAHDLALDGWVRNDAGGVTIDVQGDPGRVERLARALREEAPRLARIDAIAAEDCAPEAGRSGFAILESLGGRTATAIGADTAVCADCLAELFDPADRRYRYAFINCTACGPRYTITRALPYDRATTSMARFAQCPACLGEYRAPGHRRFHAEPNACPLCGPRLDLRDASGAPIAAADPIADVVARLRRGEIVAIKGLGGFHLACDARNATAVAALRTRKGREEKPFAVMVANVASAAGLAGLGADEAAMLSRAERPIVLLRKRPAADGALQGVAPGLAWLGVMLPYTPIQYLLFHEAAGRPAGTKWLEGAQDLVLVMTSANPGGEPLVVGNDEAVERLRRIADAFLMHDREIVARCDDSVVRAAVDPNATGPRMQFIRRARGFTPTAIRLPEPGPSVIATGGYFKNTICVTRGDEAFLSPHIGELDNAPTCAALVDAVDHLCDVLEVEPEAVACDLHPDFFSTRHAANLAEARGIPRVPVQHHQAHIGAIAAEHRVTRPILGLALDGVGLGTDGAAWGGELLRVDGATFRRLAHLRPIRLPGGDRAAREPWRMAASVLAAAGRPAEIGRRFGPEPGAAAVTEMLARGVHAPETTSMGRWFDAAAGLAGIAPRMSFEGQAAMLYEGLAERHGPVEPARGLHAISADGTLDLLPLVGHLADIDDPGRAAALFHATLVEALAEWAQWAAEREGLTTVALGGGCFLNALLAGGLVRALEARGLEPLEARQAPPNDGGLALGQAWVALRRLKEGL